MLQVEVPLQVEVFTKARKKNLSNEEARKRQVISIFCNVQSYNSRARS
jgi:hypothetical protein